MPFDLTPGNQIRFTMTVNGRPAVAVEFGTSLAEAWTLMRTHGIKALPVVDRVRRLVGRLAPLVVGLAAYRLYEQRKEAEAAMPVRPAVSAGGTRP